MVSFVESLPLGRGNFFMCWDFIDLTRDHLSISVFMYAETLLRSKTNNSDTTGLAKDTTDSPVQIQNTILSTFRDGYSSHYTLMFGFFKQLYELLLKNLSS